MMRLMPATVAALTKIAFTLLCCTVLMLAGAPAWADVAPDPCNAPTAGGATPAVSVGTATGCGAVITVTGVDPDTKAATFFTVTRSGNGNGNPYDPGGDDTLIGIVNNSGQMLNSITLTAPPISGVDNLFAFETPAPGDGPCSFNYPANCFGGATGYEGPNNSFSGYTNNTTTGTVNFFTVQCPDVPNTCSQAAGIGSGTSTWFALEGTPDSLTSIQQTQPTPPGVTTLFNFGPFNWKSTPAASTQDGNSLSITAIPVTAGTQINFVDGTHGNCITYLSTGGNCRAFDIKCNGPNCDATTYFAEFSTAYDVDHTIVRPGLAKGDPDCSIIPNISTTLFTNQIDSFSQTSKDPTTHGRSGGDGSCWFAVENVSYPVARLSVTKVAPFLVKSGATLPYGIAVLNFGPGTATALTVTDPVPTGTSFQSSVVCFTSNKGISCLSGTNSPCTLTGNMVTCQLGNLLPFSLKTLAAIGIQLNFNVTTAGLGTTIPNTATANDANNIPNPGTNSNLVNTKVCRDIVKGKCIL